METQFESADPTKLRERREMINNIITTTREIKNKRENL